MRFFKLFCLVTIICLPSICHAGAVCPWINEATAVGILGTTEDSASVRPPEISATTCSFTVRSGVETRMLHISVEQEKNPAEAFIAYKNKCAHAAVPLRAMGNEAVMCPAPMNQGEQVFGRVRDNLYAIVVSTTSTRDPSFSGEALEQKIQLAAEQVSGNLF
jgi:hypothetical protein